MKQKRKKRVPGTGGAFAVGHSGGPGRSPYPEPVRLAKRAMSAEFITACEKHVDIEEIVKKVVALARAGEPWAIQTILDRCVGAVSRSVNLKAHMHHTTESDSLLIEELAKRCAIPTVGKIKPSE